jgi:hypothetical protein
MYRFSLLTSLMLLLPLLPPPLLLLLLCRWCRRLLRLKLTRGPA